MLRTRTIAGAIAAALVFSAPAFAGTQPFSNVIVFGDSLSDAGNISLASDPSVQPPLEFTTNPGSVTVQNVAKYYGYDLTASLAGGNDYAWGGAGIINNSPGTPSSVPTITAQITSYLATSKVQGSALYTLWGGANDIFYSAAAAGSGAISSTQAQANIVAAAQQEVVLIKQLQAAGVKNLVVFNLPNIGLTPEAQEAGAASASALTSLSLIYNGQLDNGLATAGKGIIPIDTYSVLNEVIANPHAFGFTNVTVPACGVGSNSEQCGPQGSGLPYTYTPGANQTYLFADGVHPTTAADVMLGEYVVSVLRAPGYISLLGEAPLASISAQDRALRDQMLADVQGSDTRVFANVDYGNQHFNGSTSSPSANGNDFDFTAGVDVRATDNISTGIALNIGQHNAEFSGGGGYQLQDISGSGFLTYHQGGGYISGYLDFGQDNFSNVNRDIQLGALLRQESGNADGNHMGGGVTGGWWFDVSSLRTGPFATVEWQTVKVDGYNESGSDSTAMWFGRQQRDSLLSTLGWRLQGHWQLGGTLLAPYAEVAYNRDSKANPTEVTAGLNGMEGSFDMAGFVPDKNWGTADVGLSAQFSPKLSAWVSLNGRFGDSSQSYESVNVGIKYAFE